MNIKKRTLKVLEKGAGNYAKMMMTKMATNAHTGVYGEARPDDFGARGGEGEGRGTPSLQCSTKNCM